MKVEEYESVKKWFEKGDYTPKTENKYKAYMDTFCYILNKTPDELANLTTEKALEAQIHLATIMKEKLHLREYSITNRVTTLHGFWRANGVALTDLIMKYHGTSWLRHARIEEK
jgi:hypothetical protein